MLPRSLFLFVFITFFGCQRQTYDEPQGFAQGFAQKRYVLDDYGQNVAKMHQFKLLFTENFTSKEQAFCMAFTSNKMLTLQEGQNLISQIVKDFLAVLQQCDVIGDVANDDVAIRITFFDEHASRIARPFLAQILYIDNTFFYYQKDEETPQLRLILKEPFSVAEWL